MSSSINSLGSAIDSAYYILKKEITDIQETLLCPITLEKMDNVLALTPCMHRVSELGYNQMQLKHKEKNCPLCREKITGVFSDPVFKSTLGDLERKLEKVTQLLESAKMNIPSISTSSKGKESVESNTEANNNNALSNSIAHDKSAKIIEVSDSSISAALALKSIQKLQDDIDEFTKILTTYKMSSPLAYSTLLTCYSKFNEKIIGFDASILQTNLCRFAYFFAIAEKLKGTKVVQEGWGKLAIEDRTQLPEIEHLTNRELESLWVKAVYVFQLNFYIYLVQNERTDILDELSKKRLCYPVILKSSRSSKVLIDALANQCPEFQDNENIRLMGYLASNQFSKDEKIARLNAVLKICLDTWGKPS